MIFFFFWCYFGSYTGSFVCKEQRFIQVTLHRESYKNKENRNLSQSSRRAKKKKKKAALSKNKKHRTVEPCGNWNAAFESQCNCGATSVLPHLPGPISLVSIQFLPAWATPKGALIGVSVSL